MKVFDQLFKLLDKLAFAGAAVSVGGMLFCVTLQVVARMTALSANWTTELSQYFFLWGTTFASYIAARRGKLIGVELIQNSVAAPIKRGMKFLSWAYGTDHTDPEMVHGHNLYCHDGGDLYAYGLQRLYGPGAAG